MRDSKLAAALLAATIGFVFLFVVGEISLRIYTAFVIYYDVEMTRYANELKLESDNPRIGHTHRPGGQSHLMGVDVSINSAGLRDDEYPVERTAARRIAFLGDSLTFGWGVEKDAMFETLIEQRLGEDAPTEILNFGTGNYNTEQQVNLFLDVGLPYAPDEVVVFFFINDAEPTPQRSKWSFLGHSRMATFLWSRIKAVRSRFVPSKSFEDYYAGLYADGEPGWQRMREAFTQLAEACRSNGIALEVVLLPELHAPEDEPFAPQHAAVIRHLDSLGTVSLDLAPRFRDETRPLELWVALDDAHPNARAHRKIADLVVPFLQPGS